MVKWRGISGSLDKLPALIIILIQAICTLGATPSMMVVARPTPPLVSNTRVPKQVGPIGGAIRNVNDQQQAAGYHHDHHHGFGHGHGHHNMDMHGHGDGKYFQYQHSPHPHEYEYGYRRGNDYHFQERYEKYGPHWNFKTKVKWGDKHAGYGEHYWDYNHAGSGDDHGHQGGGGGGGGDGGYYDGGGQNSDPVPTYEQAQSSDKRSSIIAKRENREKLKNLRESKRIVGRMNENEKVKNGIEDSQASPSASTPAMRGNYGERGSQLQRPSPSAPSLMLDTRSGQVIDESTGNAYWLKPANGPY